MQQPHKFYQYECCKGKFFLSWTTTLLTADANFQDPKCPHAILTWTSVLSSTISRIGTGRGNTPGEKQRTLSLAKNLYF